MNFHYQGTRTSANLNIHLILNAYAAKPLGWTQTFGFFFDAERDYPGLQSQLIATPGHSYEVTIKGTRINKYPSPYSDCTVLADSTLIDPLEDSTYYDRVLRTGYSYSRAACFAVCQQLIFYKKCSCNNLDFSYVSPNINYCLSTSQCKIDADRYKNISEYFLNCRPMCPYECTNNLMQHVVNVYTLPPTYFTAS